MKKNRRFISFIAFNVIIIAFSAFIIIPIINNVVLVDTPFHIHATWSEANASKSLTLTWRVQDTSIGMVKYDTLSRNGIASSYASQTPSAVQTHPSIQGYIHSVPLINLLPNKTYYFICGSSNGWSNELKFRTPALTPEKILFIAGGDQQDNPSVHSTISQLMAQLAPEFVLFLGDAVQYGTNQPSWDQWFNILEENWIHADGTIIPIIPCLGNHEGNASNYYTQYSLPNNEQWYSIDYSSILHIICLNSETNIGGEQLNWLENDLETHKDVLWKIVLFHQPPYSDPYRLDIRNTWSPLFDKYNVTVVFNGHHHLYERTFPIYNQTVQSSYENGTMYVTSGGWGANLHEIWTEEKWLGYSEMGHHFCYVTINMSQNTSTLTLNQIRLNNTVGDSITIERNWTLIERHFL